jgi:hypothetical protein
MRSERFTLQLKTVTMQTLPWSNTVPDKQGKSNGDMLSFTASRWFNCGAVSPSSLEAGVNMVQVLSILQEPHFHHMAERAKFIKHL